MNKKELEKMKELKKTVNKDILLIKKLEHDLLNIKSPSSFKHAVTYSNYSTDKKADILDYIEELKKDISLDKKELKELEKKFYKDIKKIKDKNIKDILIFRYIFNFNFRKISKIKFYSESYIYKLHNIGVKKLGS